MDPEGKVALVTGGAQGIGLAIVKELLTRGVKGVSLCDIKEKEGKAVVQQLRHEFGKDRIIFIKTDVADEDEFKDAFKDTLKNFGGLDIAVNNAGIFNDKTWQKEVAINMNGVIHGNFLALKYMGRDQNGSGGVVINMASVSGLASRTVLPVYSATKHAIVGFTRTLGNEFLSEKTGVRVMAVCPGVTDTTLLKNISPETRVVTYRMEWMPKLMEHLKAATFQKEENVSAAVMHVIRAGKSGSIWVVENKPAYEIKFPHYSELEI